MSALAKLLMQIACDEAGGAAKISLGTPSSNLSDYVIPYPGAEARQPGVGWGASSVLELLTNSITSSIRGTGASDPTPNVSVASVNAGLAHGGSTKTLGLVASNLSVGGYFMILRPSEIQGVRFLSEHAGTHNVKVSIWLDGTRVKTGTESGIAGPGQYEHTFSTPLVVAAADVYKVYTVSMWEDSGTDTTAIWNSPIPDGYGQLATGVCVRYLSRFSYSNAGDTEPQVANYSATDLYPVDPIVVPTA